MGELRDHSFEKQRYRASGLNLVVAAIALWNTVYPERAVQSLKAHGQAVDDSLLTHLSPLAWEHINLTGGLCLATEQTGRAGQIQATTPVRKSLTYDLSVS